jgi:CoA:oxalate CoA-transferase
LCAALQLERLADDSRFDTFEARWTNRIELRRLLEERFASASSAQWARELANHQLVFEIVRSPTEIGDDPQVLANDYVVETQQSAIGRVKRIGLPLHINGNSCAVGDAAPMLGQHTEEVLMSVMGLTWKEIDELHSSGAI